MNPTEQKCDCDRIDDYLDERLNESARGAFEEHLSNCDFCQIELQRRAAEPDIWRDALELLREPRQDSSADFADSAESGTDQYQVLSILESLAATDDPEMLGRLGDYEISGVVGVGGMGTVLKGFDRTLRRVVAIKVMAPHLAGSGSARTRFQREARAAAAITHSNVIDTYGVSEKNGLPYLVMPFARGQSLQKRIDAGGPLTAVEVVRIGHQIASGLGAAHEQGLVHRDIKPANILLNEGIERLWITDFGVARAVDDASMTRTGLIAGTPQYMSPEQARGESVDHRSDLFSMGSVLYTACTGRPPFRSEAAWGILRRITDTDPRPIREINPEIPDWLCRIVERLMARHPSDRYQTAGEVAELCEGCLAHLQQPTHTRLPESVRSSRQSEEDASVQEGRNSVSVLPAGKRDGTPLQRVAVPVALASVLLAGLALLGVQLTAAADISGVWYGEQWNEVTLSSVEEADGWYNGTFGDTSGRRGTLQLEWSRLQQRFNGRWKTGDDQSGSLTLRVSGSEVRGAVTIDGESPVSAATPRLREFTWQRDARLQTGRSPSTRRSSRPSSISIESPVSGRLVSWADGLDEQSRVSRGDVLAHISNEDAELRERLSARLDSARRRVKSGEAVIKASQLALEANRNTIAALRSRQENYAVVKELTAEANRAANELASGKVETARSVLEGHKASLSQLKADYERQKSLHEKEIVGDEKLQSAQRKFAAAQAHVQASEALLQTAENEVVALSRDREIQVSRAQVDLEAAAAELSRAQGDAAALELDLMTASDQWEQAQKSVLELETQLARSETMTIRSPVDGVLQTIHISTGAVVNEGDLICEVSLEETAENAQISAAPNAAPSLAAPSPAAPSLAAPSPAAPSPAAPSPAAPLPAVPDPQPAPGMPAGPLLSTLPMTQMIEAALALGRRIHDARDRAGVTAATADGGQHHDALTDDQKGLLESAERERQTGTTILQVRLDAARNLHRTHTALLDRVQEGVARGDLNPPDLLQARLAVLTTQAQVRQLEALLEYYNSPGPLTGDEESEDGDIAVRVLTIELELGQKRLDLRTQQANIARERFTLGESEMNDMLNAQQAESQAASQLKELEVLMDYYDRRRSDRANPSSDPPTEAPPADRGDAGIED